MTLHSLCPSVEGQTSKNEQSKNDARGTRIKIAALQITSKIATTSRLTPVARQGAYLLLRATIAQGKCGGRKSTPAHSAAANSALPYVLCSLDGP